MSGKFENAQQLNQFITHLGNLHILDESSSKVLEHNAVRAGEKGKDVLHKVTLVIGEFLPVFHVISKVDLFGCV